MPRTQNKLDLIRVCTTRTLSPSLNCVYHGNYMWRNVRCHGFLYSDTVTVNAMFTNCKENIYEYGHNNSLVKWANNILKACTLIDLMRSRPTCFPLWARGMLHHDVYKVFPCQFNPISTVEIFAIDLRLFCLWHYLRYRILWITQLQGGPKSKCKPLSSIITTHALHLMLLWSNHHHLSVTHRSFRRASPHLWNQLPTSLRIPHPNYSSPSQRPSFEHAGLTCYSLLSPSVTFSMFHSDFKNYLFRKSYPPP